MRTSDGKVGKASAADGTIENAQVVGFAQISALTDDIKSCCNWIKRLYQD